MDNEQKIKDKKENEQKQTIKGIRIVKPRE